MILAGFLGMRGTAWLSFLGVVFCQLSGVVNQYSPVTAFPGPAQVEVFDVTPFAPGDRILVYQAKGATISTNNNNSYGTILNLNGAGLFEFANIQSISGATLNLTCPLTRPFGDPATDAIQVVKVSYHATDVSVDGQVYAQPWDGKSGGLVVIETEGTLTLNADIKVSGQGFRGGTRSLNQNTGTCFSGDPDLYRDTTWYGPTSIWAGNKGEGIAAVPNGQHTAHRGKLANGGGGGNLHNCGGGGGGNYGTGGKGGWTTCACVGNSYATLQLSPSGVGGEGLSGYLTPADPRLFFGGGGGGGQQNNNEGGNGGHGGGIILLRAAQIVGNPGAALVAEGSVPAQNLGPNCANANTASSGNDGAGGGGAGGSIALYCPTFTGNILISVVGARGQHASWQTCPCINTPDHGPGGGGAGGLVAFSEATLPPGVSLALAGGANGQERSPRNENVNGCNNSSNTNCIPPGPDRFDRGATPGDPGGYLLDLAWNPVSPCPLAALQLRRWHVHLSPTGFLSQEWELEGNLASFKEVTLAFYRSEAEAFPTTVRLPAQATGRASHQLPTPGTYTLTFTAHTQEGAHRLLGRQTLHWGGAFTLREGHLILPPGEASPFTLYDASGRRLYQGTLHPTQPQTLNLHSYPAGLYLLNLDGQTYRFLLSP